MSQQGLTPQALHYLEQLSSEEILNLPRDWFASQNPEIFWHEACRRFYDMAPLPDQDSFLVFWSEYIYQEAMRFHEQSLLRQQLLLESAQHHNFNALAALNSMAITEKDFDTALAYAEKASMIYGTPGQLLIVHTYREHSLCVTDNKQALKQCAMNALRHLHLAVFLAPESELAMANTNCILPEQGIEKFRSEFIKLGDLSAHEIQTATPPDQNYQAVAEH
jgi:hypothetical protein